MSETRTTRHHHTNCAIHGTLVDGKLRDCTCAATPPTPDRAADGEADFAAADAIAEAYLVIGGLGDVLPDAREMARAYLALRARPALPADVQAAVANLRMSVPDDNCLERCGEEWCSHALEVIRCEGYNQALDDLLAHLTREAR